MSEIPKTYDLRNKYLIRGVCKSSLSILAIAVVLGIAFCATNVLAQSGAGSIEGTVTDSMGSVIEGASIHVVNTETGVANDTKPNRVGFYQVPGLFTGTYTVTVTASGMKTYATSIDLLVAQSAVINPVLTPGAVTQQVIVSGNTVQLTTTDSGVVSSTLENDRITQLPENGRLLTTLTQMSTPGLENTGERANGLLLNGMEYRVDGVDTTNLVSGGESNTKVLLMDPDSTQEVQTLTTNGGAQYSTAATAIVTTKSGTNHLHGTAFETARNNAWGIAKTRADAYNYAAPPYIRNEFGASAGGPIIVPHVYHGKDKSFWFFAYERYSLAQRASAGFEVPTMAMRQGNFSGATSSAGVLQTIYDPSTTVHNTACPVAGSNTTSNNTYCRTPFADNTIPLGEESPTAATLFTTMPLPTSSANPLVADNLTTLDNSFQVVAQETFRLDHVFNENNRAYLRFTDNDSPVVISTNSKETSLAAAGLPAGATEGYENTPLQTFITAVGYTHVFSPTFYAETIAAEQWFDVNTFKGNDPGAKYESELGMPNSFGQPGFPTVSGLIDSLVSTQTTTDYHQIIWNIDENLTKIAGKHQLHFGEHWQHYRDADQPAGKADAIAFNAQPTGLYNSSTGANYTNSTNTGIADASFFLGSAGSYTEYLPSLHAHYHWNDIDAYLQDDYHVSRNLTFNFGLRYAARPGSWVKYGLNNTIDFKTGAIVTSATPATLIAEGYTTQSVISNLQNIGVVFETPQQAGMPASLERNYDLNFLPRVGFAYQIFSGKGTVVRGAFGRYTERTDLEDYLNSAINNDPLVDDWVQSYTTAAQAIDNLPDELLRYNDPVKFCQLGGTPSCSGAVNTSTTNSILPGISQWAVDPNWAPDLVSEANFTVEQPFKGNSVLRVSWVWTHSSNLDIAHDFNNNPSTFQWEMAHGVVPPTGGASVIGTPLQNTYSATATGPYNQTIYASGSSFHTKTGWMNDNSLQVNYQRLFHHGFAYQIYYVYSKDLRAGGSVGGGHADTVGSTTDPYANYPGAEGAMATMTSPYGTIGTARVAPAPPANWPLWEQYHALNHYELYSLDNEIPIHHVQFNGILDMPIGRGKRLLGNANRFLNELVGGYQIAGQGSIVSQVFLGPSSNWGAVAPIHVYKHKYPITDCSSGVCYKEFLWNNGYLSPKVTQGVAGSVCTTNCITGLPSSYIADQTPIDNNPTSTYFGENEVQIQAPNINSGALTNIAYDAGPTGANYGSHTFLNGPINWEADASLFKVFPIKENVSLRINMDAFNVFNNQGYNNPSTTSGEEEVQPGVGVATSYNTARQIQFTARITF